MQWSLWMHAVIYTTTSLISFVHMFLSVDSMNACSDLYHNILDLLLCTFLSINSMNACSDLYECMQWSIPQHPWFPLCTFLSIDSINAYSDLSHNAVNFLRTYFPPYQLYECGDLLHKIINFLCTHVFQSWLHECISQMKSLLQANCLTEKS